MLHWEWAVFGESVVLVHPILKGSFAFPTFSPPLLAIANTITKEPSKLRKNHRILPPIFSTKRPFALTRGGEFLELDPFATWLTQSRFRLRTCLGIIRTIRNSIWNILIRKINYSLDKKRKVHGYQPILLFVEKIQRKEDPIFLWNCTGRNQ